MLLLLTELPFTDGFFRLTAQYSTRPRQSPKRTDIWSAGGLKF
jgi:hypothetical protein